jgi:hypothetical protein
MPTDASQTKIPPEAEIELLVWMMNVAGFRVSAQRTGVQLIAEAVPNGEVVGAAQRIIVKSSPGNGEQQLLNALRELATRVAQAVS